MAFTPTTDQYADAPTAKLPLWKDATDASPESVLTQLLQDATLWAKSKTWRSWVPEVSQTLTYTAPLSSLLYTADFVDPTAISVYRGGVLVDPSTYVWVWDTILGQYRHAYAVRLLTGTWADSANLAGRSVAGDVTLTDAAPGTTLLPPGPIVQAVIRVAAVMYRQRSVSYSTHPTGTAETGRSAPPPEVEPDDALTLLGPFIHPRRVLGRP